MGKKLNIAIVGATGAVGEAFFQVLEQRKFPINKIYALASERSLDQTILFKNKNIPVQDLAKFDFKQVEIALFSAGNEISKQYAPLAVEAGCIVIDNSSCFRYDDDVPLIVPEVNAHKIPEGIARGIIANPNCSTIQLVVALKPIYDAVGISRINVSTYQAVSGTGKAAISELIEQLGQLLNGRPVIPSVYPKQIAFNVLPHIDCFLENNYTREEMKMVWETQKIMEDDQIRVNVTAVRVPVIYGHSEAVNIELRNPLSAEKARQILNKSSGIKVIDEPAKNKYPTPFVDANGKDHVFVGRIREDISHPQALNLWIVADNVRKGAATNAIQIAEILQNEHF